MGKPGLAAQNQNQRGLVCLQAASMFWSSAGTGNHVFSFVHSQRNDKNNT